MTESEQVRGVREYYVRSEENGDQPSIYHIWESGGGRGNVTTPATSSQSYRQSIVELLRTLLAGSRDPRLLSIGCGNGMVEAAIAADGVRVLAVDAMESAIELAKAKGLDAVCADALSWTPPSEPWTVVYADGSLGHLYDADTGLQQILRRFQSWIREDGLVVVSNDPPWSGDAEVEKHPDLDYWFLSESYMRGQIEECGFRDVTSTMFTFEKPLSGERERIVVTGRK
jgi:SAM-dependent methyltransferase